MTQFLNSLNRLSDRLLDALNVPACSDLLAARDITRATPVGRFQAA